MAIKHLSPIDLNLNELQNAKIQNLGSDPGAPTPGQIYYHTGTSSLKFYNGSWTTLSSGTVADATTGAKGIIQLAGDLGGSGTTAAVPVISASAITATKIDTTLKPSGSAAAGTESLRALGATSSTALAGNTRLDQIAAPTTSVSLNSQKITSLLDPSAAQDAASKAYVDTVASGLDAKTSAVAATTGSETYTVAANAVTVINGTTLDGITIALNDRILVKDAPAASGVGSVGSNQPANGIYTVTNATTNLTISRTTDMDIWAEVPSAYIWVERGTAQADTGWVVTSDPGGTINTTAIKWTMFTASTQIIDGNGLLKTGNTFDVQVDASSIEINSDILRVKALGITNAMLAGSIDVTTKITGAVPIGNGGTGQTTAKAGRETGLAAAGYYSSATHGAGTSISITQATHLLRASKGLLVQVQDETSGAVEFADVVVASSGDVTVTFAVSQSANTKRVTIIG